MSTGRRFPAGPLILDSGGLIAYADGDSFARAFCLHIQQTGFPVIVPTAVYAQVERGGTQRSLRQQRLNALLNFCDHAPLSMAVAYQAGVLLGLARTNDVVDAVVVIEALNHEGAIIFTSDSGDIQHLLGFSANRQRRGIRVVRS